jgi:CHAT domain-containing protein
VLDALDDHPFVHFAVHGQFMSDDPTHSGLILGGGRLTLDRLYTRENATAARLTVLSACQTAVTDMQSLPEEAIGLPAALLRAGYAAVVGTLWPVNDVSTALLTMRFYTSLIERAEAAGDFHPAAALRDAQHWLRRVTHGELARLFSEYRTLPGDGNKSLRNTAQRAYRQHTLADPDSPPPYADPVYWAGFSCYGS